MTEESNLGISLVAEPSVAEFWDIGPNKRYIQTIFVRNTSTRPKRIRLSSLKSTLFRVHHENQTAIAPGLSIPFEIEYYSTTLSDADDIIIASCDDGSKLEIPVRARLPCAVFDYSTVLTFEKMLPKTQYSQDILIHNRGSREGLFEIVPPQTNSGVQFSLFPKAVSIVGGGSATIRISVQSAGGVAFTEMFDVKTKGVSKNDHPGLSITVSGVFVKQSLRVVVDDPAMSAARLFGNIKDAEDLMENFNGSDIDFGSMYFGETRRRTCTLINDGPFPVHYRGVLLTDDEALEICQHLLHKGGNGGAVDNGNETVQGTKNNTNNTNNPDKRRNNKLNTDNKKAAAVVSLIPTSRDLQGNEDPLKGLHPSQICPIGPLHGTLPAFGKVEISFVMQPPAFKFSKGFIHNRQPENIHVTQLVAVRFECDELDGNSNQSFSYDSHTQKGIVVKAKAKFCVPSIFNDPENILFGHVAVNKRKDARLLLRNAHRDLRVSFALGKLPHFFAKPAQGVLGPGELQSVIVSFCPRNIGDFDEKIPVYARLHITDREIEGHDTTKSSNKSKVFKCAEIPVSAHAVMDIPEHMQEYIAQADRSRELDTDMPRLGARITIQNSAFQAQLDATQERLNMEQNGITREGAITENDANDALHSKGTKLISSKTTSKGLINASPRSHKVNYILEDTKTPLDPLPIPVVNPRLGHQIFAGGVDKTEKDFIPRFDMIPSDPRAHQAFIDIAAQEAIGGALQNNEDFLVGSVPGVVELQQQMAFGKLKKGMRPSEAIRAANNLNDAGKVLTRLMKAEDWADEKTDTLCRLVDTLDEKAGGAPFLHRRSAQELENHIKNRNKFTLEIRQWARNRRNTEKREKVKKRIMKENPLLTTASKDQIESAVDAAMFIDPFTDPNLGMPFAQGLKPPRLSRAEIPDEPLWLSRRPATNIDGLMRGVTGQIYQHHPLQFFKKKFKPKPNSPQDSADILKELQPWQLALVSIGPLTLDFGTLNVNTVSMRSLSAFNDLHQSVLAELVIPTDAGELQESAPHAQVIPSTRVTGFDIVLRSDRPCSIHRSITLMLNKVHPVRVTVMAQIVPVRLHLSKFSLDLAFSEETIELVAKDSITLTNLGNGPAEFEWVLDDPAGSFAITPISGTVKAGGVTEVSNFLFASPAHGQIVEATATLRVKDGEPVSVRLTGFAEAAEIMCNTRKIDFGCVAIGDKVERTLSLLNEGAAPAIFRIDTSLLPPGISVTPSRGKVAGGGGKMELTVAVTMNEAHSFEDLITIAVRGGKSLKIAAACRAVLPVVTISEPELNLVDVTVGSTASTALTLKNHSEVEAVLVFDLRGHDEFTIDFADMNALNINNNNNNSSNNNLSSSPRANSRLGSDRPMSGGSLVGKSPQTNNGTPNAFLYSPLCSLTRLSFSQLLEILGPTVTFANGGAPAPRNNGGVSSGGHHHQQHEEEAMVDAYKVVLAPGASIPLQLQFTPVCFGEHSFELVPQFPGGSIPEESRRVVYASALRPRLLVSSSTVDLGCKVILSHATGAQAMPKVQELHLSNADNQPLSWVLGIQDALSKFPDVFYAEPKSGIIPENGETIVKISFQPREPMHYSLTLPIFVSPPKESVLARNGRPSNMHGGLANLGFKQLSELEVLEGATVVGTVDGVDNSFLTSALPVDRAKPYLNVKLTGEGMVPRLLFDRNLVSLPVVPLGVRSRASLNIFSEGFEVVELTAKIPGGDGSAIPLQIDFPEGNLHGSARDRLPLEISFVSPKPISFLAKVEIVDSDGVAYPLEVCGSSDNSLLTVYDYVSKHADTITVAGFPPLLTELPSVNTASIGLIDDPTGVAGMSKEEEFDTSDTDFLVKWLNNTILQTPIESFPGDLISNFGRPLIEIAEALSGKKLKTIRPDLTPPAVATKGNYNANSNGSVTNNSNNNNASPSTAALDPFLAAFEDPKSFKKGSRNGSNNKNNISGGSSSNSNTNNKKNQDVFPQVALVHRNLKGDPRLLHLINQYEGILSGLKLHGALLSGIFPEHLLNLDQFVKFSQAQVDSPIRIQTNPGSPPLTIRQWPKRLLEKKFYKASHEAWASILFQTVKVFLLNRITPQGLMELPIVTQTPDDGEPLLQAPGHVNIDNSAQIVRGKGDAHAMKEESLSSADFALARADFLENLSTFIVPPGLSGPASVAAANAINTQSNILSVQEICLLKWLDWCYLVVDRGQKPTTVTDFVSLKDGILFSTALIAHIPELANSQLNTLRRHCVSPDQCIQNVQKLLTALRQIGQNSIVSAEDIVNGNSRDLVLFTLFLWQILPHFLPRSTINFSAALGTKTTKLIELTNPGKSRLEYMVKLTGSNAFTVLPPGNNKRTYHNQESNFDQNGDAIQVVCVEPKEVLQLPVQFVALFARPADAKLTLAAKKDGASGGVNAGALVFSLQATITSKEPSGSDEIEGPLYEVTNKEITVRNPLPQSGEFLVSYRTELIDPVTGARGTANGIRSALNMDPTLSCNAAFFSSIGKIKIKAEDTVTIPVEFFPIERAGFLCTMKFIDAQVGEFYHEITGLVQLPAIQETFKFNCRADDTLKKEITLTTKNTPAHIDKIKSRLASKGIARMNTDTKSKTSSSSVGNLQSGPISPFTPPTNEAIIYQVWNSSALFKVPKYVIVLPNGVMSFSEIDPSASEPTANATQKKQLLIDDGVRRAASMEEELIKFTNFQSSHKKNASKPVKSKEPSPKETKLVSNLNDSKRLNITASPLIRQICLLPNPVIPQISTLSMTAINKLPIELSPGSAGTYTSTLILTSNFDTRVLAVEASVAPLPMVADLAFKTNARKQITQMIPISNPTENEWTVRITASEERDEDNKIIPVTMNNPAWFEVPKDFTIRKSTNKENISIGQIPIVFKPISEGIRKMTITVQIPATDQTLKFNVTGVAEGPAAEDHVIIFADVRKPTVVDIRLSNPISRFVELVMESDLPMAVSGPRSIQLQPREQNASFPLTVTPLWSGSFKGTITFKEKYGGTAPLRETSGADSVDANMDDAAVEQSSFGVGLHFNHSLISLWFSASVEVPSPPPLQEISLSSKVREAAVLSLAIDNPLDDSVSFDVTLDCVPENAFGSLQNGNSGSQNKFMSLMKSQGISTNKQYDFLLGDSVHHLAPLESKAAYEAVFSPLIPGDYRGAVRFISPSVGEFWYALKLQALPAPIIEIPEILQCEVGSSTTATLTIENPLSESINLRVKSANRLEFRPLYTAHNHVSSTASLNTNAEMNSVGLFTIEPFSVGQLPVEFTPASVGQPTSTLITCEHPTAGTWEFSLKGMGLAPSEVKSLDIVGAVGIPTSQTIAFKNPFPRSLTLHIFLRKAVAVEVDDDGNPTILSLSNEQSHEEAIQGASVSARTLGDFELLTRRQKITLGPHAITQIPVSFSPSSLASSQRAELVLLPVNSAGSTSNLEDFNRPFTWVFGLRGIAEAPLDSTLRTVHVKAREVHDEILSLPLLGLRDLATAAAAASGRRPPPHASAFLNGGSTAAVNALLQCFAGGVRLGVSLLPPNNSGLDSLIASAMDIQAAHPPLDEKGYARVHVRFSPLRPFTADCQLVLELLPLLGSTTRTGNQIESGAGGGSTAGSSLQNSSVVPHGRWRFELRLIATPAPVDDIITIAAEVGKTAAVQFRLCNNTSDQFAPFEAFFAPHMPSSNFTVSPESGVLAPPPTGSQTGGGTLFTVTFSAREYGRPSVAELHIQTATTLWTFKVVGALPTYKKPSKNTPNSGRKNTNSPSSANHNSVINVIPGSASGTKLPPVRGALPAPEK